ncbi:diguanylate cyclase [uncultured Shimia sp.]|uniref:diguanylate cyclase n=1 Tax=uncultured Shimia sp. TaxID=573152 RepID=UPI0026152029|nr:diguanylate cyclase [uncultured Shimia sp.]
MPGKILIFDSVPTNRIVLKVKLSAAFYQVVQAGTLKEVQMLVRRGAPDLILIGNVASGTRERLEDVRVLRQTAESMQIPILMIAEHVSRDLRVKALKAGADHIFEKPVDESALLARIRALLRLREANEDLSPRARVAQSLGFAEASPPAFETCAQVLFATSEARLGLSWCTRLKPIVPYALSHKPVAEALQGLQRLSAPDSFVIALDEATPEDGLRLLAEIRARAATRNCGVLVVVPLGCDSAQTDALDLGASDVMTEGFDPEEMSLRLAAIIKRKRLRDTLRRNVREGLEAAVTDPLTGLHNRRFALPHLDRVAEFSRRGHHNFAVMVADLDHFKAINDRYGHTTGDAVLVAVAERLREALRPIDLLARIGGEEFLIVLPATTLETARFTATQLCARIGEDPVHLKKKDLQVPATISIGVALAQDNARGALYSGADLLDEADRALYRAKSTGRNQVFFTSQSAPNASGAAMQS